MNLRYKPGLRAVKTSLAVFLCLLINLLVGRHSSFFTVIAAIIGMQPTYSKSFEVGVGRIIGTIGGAVAGFLVLEAAQFIPSYRQWSHVIIVPVAITLIIYLFNVIDKRDALAIGCIVFAGIVLDFERGMQDTLLYVVNRVVDTGVGVLIAVLVNRFFFPNREAPPASASPPAAAENTEPPNEKP